MPAFTPQPSEELLMRVNRLIPIALLAFPVACSETSSNPMEEHNGPLAASVHLKGGANAEPTFFDAGLFLRTSGALSGLGNGNITVELSATGNPTATCTSPGGNDSPGQNPAQVTLTGVQEIPEGSIKNGNVAFNVQTAAPVSPVPGAPACPNPNWTETITNVAFTSATIVVRQPSTAAALGPVVLTVTCTFTTPTSNGSVPGTNVSCTQS
jgi:hypothetical protein